MIHNIIHSIKVRTVTSMLLSGVIVASLSTGKPVTPKLLTFIVVSHFTNLPFLAHNKEINQIGDQIIQKAFAKEVPMQTKHLLYNGEYFDMDIDPEIQLTPQMVEIFYNNYKLSKQIKKP